MRAPLLLCVALGAILGLVGCSHYRLGTEADHPRFATLHVAIIKSDTLLPQAQTIVTTAVREAFIKDGRVRLVDSAADAEATLVITLSDYSRAVTVSRADDTGLARRFDISLVARATLTDSRAHRDLFKDRPLVAKRGVFTDSGQIQSEYQNLPLLASDLADKAVKAALDVW